MIRVMLWKTYREHLSVWVLLGTLGLATLISITWVFAPRGFASHQGLHQGVRDALCGIAVVVSWTYGMVAGAMLLANESEEGTLTFLDSVPGTRLVQWVSKSICGLLLVLAQVALLAGVGIWLGLVEGELRIFLGVGMLLFAGLVGYAWGLWSSARSKAVLDAILLAFGAQMLGWPLFAGIVAVGVGLSTWVLAVPTLFEPIYVVGTGLLMVIVPTVLSFRTWTRVDRQRKQIRVPWERSRQEGGVVRPKTFAPGWKRCFWLATQQARSFSLGTLGLAVILGLIGLMSPLLAWPIVTVLLGVLCGVTVWTDEQISGSFRHLAAQRLPLWKLAVSKLVLRAGLALVATLIVFLPILVSGFWQERRTVPEVWGWGPEFLGFEEGAVSRPEFALFCARMFRTGLLFPLMPPGIYLAIWVVTGFCVGQLFGLLFRRPLVAVVVSLGVTILLVSVWLPSLLGEGLHAWQVFGVPAVLLASSFVLLHPWASERLRSSRVAMILSGVAVGCVGWLAFGLWYRVWEIPAIADPYDMPAFVASLPTPEQNQAGRHIRQACQQFRDNEAQVLAHLPPQGGAAGPGGGQGAEPSLRERLILVAGRGWKKDPELADWLDQVFAGKWDEELARANKHPLGMVIDPRKANNPQEWNTLNHCREMVLLLLARGMQLQAAGKSTPFVDHLETCLMLARNLRNKAPVLSAMVARVIEFALFQSLDLWLPRACDDPALLKRVRQLLLEHEDATPGPDNQEQAEYLMAQDLLRNPAPSLQDIVGPGPSQTDPRFAINEVPLVVMAWGTPWEASRQRRLLLLAVQGDAAQRQWARQRNLMLRVWGPSPKIKDQKRLRWLCEVRARRLIVSLCLYRTKEGKPAQQLGDLVTKGYLTSVPRDPYAQGGAQGQPFRYRLSAGEVIPWPHSQEEFDEAVARGIQLPEMGKRRLPAGQGVLWSVWEDGQDGGGLQPVAPGVWGGGDMVYLVPEAKK